MEEVSSGRPTSRFMVCQRMTLVLLQLKNLKPRGKQTERNAWAVTEEVILRVDDAPRRHGVTCQQ